MRPNVPLGWLIGRWRHQLAVDEHGAATCQRVQGRSWHAADLVQGVVVGSQRGSFLGFSKRVRVGALSNARVQGGFGVWFHTTHTNAS